MTQRQKDNLELPSAEHQAIESSQAGVETWKYKAKNSLMYYPEGEQPAGVGVGLPSVLACLSSGPPASARLCSSHGVARGSPP